MATNNQKNTTKVICSNCGAEVVIPNTTYAATGMVVAKDSNLGTVILPTTGGGHCCEASPMTQLAAMLGSNPETLTNIMNLVNQINEGGFLDVDGIVRRWIPSQCLHMLNSSTGFHQALSARGYEYMWKVLVNEYKRQAALFADKDLAGYTDRNRWYNKQIVVDAATDYLQALEKATKAMPRRNCKGRKYIPVRCKMNARKGVFVDEIPDFLNALNKRVVAIKKAATPKGLYEAVKKFNDARRDISWQPSKITNSFTNAYKASGAYYTMKDLIMFEGCRLRIKEGSQDTTELTFTERRNGTTCNFAETQQSLEILEKRAEEVVERGVAQYGYQLLGLIQSFLKYNSFDFEATKEKWYEQSALRKTLRTAGHVRRSRK